VCSYDEQRAEQGSKPVSARAVFSAIASKNARRQVVNAATTARTLSTDTRPVRDRENLGHHHCPQMRRHPRPESPSIRDSHCHPFSCREISVSQPAGLNLQSVNYLVKDTAASFSGFREVLRHQPRSLDLSPFACFAKKHSPLQKCGSHCGGRMKPGSRRTVMARPLLLIAPAARQPWSAAS
jgi:hypothetical protein